MIPIRAAALTDIGRVRRRNEDRMIADFELGLYGVADGVGGLPGGAEAAELALEHLRKGLADTKGAPDLEKLVRDTNKAVFKLGREISPGSGIASTLTVGFVQDSTMQIAHVGDSRCYALRGDTFELLTTDHSVENEVRERRARGEDVHFHEVNRNALTRCIGQPDKLAVDLVQYPLEVGDRILFCSDGISGLIPEEELGQILAEHREIPPDATLQAIIDLAIKRGGHDNATGVLLYLDSRP